jgi:hypothetical protein
MFKKELHYMGGKEYLDKISENSEVGVGGEWDLHLGVSMSFAISIRGLFLT